MNKNSCSSSSSAGADTDASNWLDPKVLTLIQQQHQQDQAAAVAETIYAGQFEHEPNGRFYANPHLEDENGDDFEFDNESAQKYLVAQNNANEFYQPQFPQDYQWTAQDEAAQFHQADAIPRGANLLRHRVAACDTSHGLAANVEADYVNYKLDLAPDSITQRAGPLFGGPEASVDSPITSCSNVSLISSTSSLSRSPSSPEPGLARVGLQLFSDAKIDKFSIKLDPIANDLLKANAGNNRQLRLQQIVSSSWPKSSFNSPVKSDCFSGLIESQAEPASSLAGKLTLNALVELVGSLFIAELCLWMSLGEDSQLR